MRSQKILSMKIWERKECEDSCTLSEDNLAFSPMGEPLHYGPCLKNHTGSHHGTMTTSWETPVDRKVDGAGSVDKIGSRLKPIFWKSRLVCFPKGSGLCWVPSVIDVFAKTWSWSDFLPKVFCSFKAGYNKLIQWRMKHIVNNNWTFRILSLQIFPEFSKWITLLEAYGLAYSRPTFLIQVVALSFKKLQTGFTI